MSLEGRELDIHLVGCPHWDSRALHNFIPSSICTQINQVELTVSCLVQIALKSRFMTSSFSYGVGYVAQAKKPTV